MTEIWDEPRDTYVYRLTDASGAVLYIGASPNPQLLPAVDGTIVTAEGPFRRSVAAAVERAAILRERPRHNLNSRLASTPRVLLGYVSVTAEPDGPAAGLPCAPVQGAPPHHRR